MNILAVGPHPDDIEIGCGGTLTRMSHAGHNVTCVCMTAADHNRYNEFLSACKIMNVRPIHFMAEDTKLEYGFNLINTLEVFRREHAPDLVFAPFPNDTHQDHRSLGKAMLAAMRYSQNLLLYESLTTIDFKPTVFSNIKEVWYKEKLRVVREHKSQLARTNITGVSLTRAVVAMAAFRGLQGRVKYAEGFVPVRYFMGV